MKTDSQIIKEQQEQMKIMRKLATSQGFYEYYFSQLPKHKTNTDCFDDVNDLYFTLFGEYKYSSYASFFQASKKRTEK